jgi:hypothetical protein
MTRLANHGPFVFHRISQPPAMWRFPLCHKLLSFGLTNFQIVPECRYEILI